MATPSTIPGYAGKVALAAVGDDLNTDGVVIPCFYLKWTAALDVDSITTAAGGIFPNCTPGNNQPGLLEFIGAWRQDFDPFSDPPLPLQLGQNMQVGFIVWANNYFSVVPQAIVASFEVIGKVDQSPLWHVIMVPTFGYYAWSDGLVMREQGGDNDEGATGESDFEP